MRRRVRVKVGELSASRSRGGPEGGSVLPSEGGNRTSTGRGYRSRLTAEPQPRHGSCSTSASNVQSMDVNYSRWMSKDPDAGTEAFEPEPRRFTMPRPTGAV